MRAHETDAVEN